MSTSISAAGSQPVWPGFRPDGGLLLALPSDVFPIPAVRALALEGQRFDVKPELHVTLLNRAVGTMLRDALGVAAIRKYFEDQDWAIGRTGDGRLLRKMKGETPTFLACGSIIERLQLPSLTRFRALLARAANVDVPELMPHVTLYTAGDPDGIGLPDLAAVNAAHVADVRLPGICNRLPPRFPHALHAAYEDARYTIGGSRQVTLRVGDCSATLDLLLQAHGANRAVLVTAYNPFSEPTDVRANVLRQQMLREQLNNAGYQVIDAESDDPQGAWPPEQGLLVLGTDHQFDDTLLRDYEQHALVVARPDHPVALALHPGHRS